MKTIMQIKPGTIKRMQFDTTELSLLVEALNHTAGQHESASRFRPRKAKPHDDKAAAMRALIKKIADSVMDVEAGEI